MAKAIVQAGNVLDTGSLQHPMLDDGTREKQVGKLPYKIVYEVPNLDRPDGVNILSIWHTAQDRFGFDRR